jgi:hypothetical protein
MDCPLHQFRRQSVFKTFVNFAPVSVENVNDFSVACTRNRITFVKTYGQLKEENMENQIPEPPVPLDLKMTKL